MTPEDVHSPLRSVPDQAEFLALAETLSSLIALIEGDRLTYVNPAGCALLGRSSEELTGTSFWSVVHPDDREAARARGQARQAGIPQPGRLAERLVHADGHTIWMEYAIDLTSIGGRQCTLVTGYDVTERKRIEDELRRSEQRFRLAFMGAAIGKAIITPDCRILQANPAMCRMLGYTEDELIGKLIDEITHPDDIASSHRYIEQQLAAKSDFSNYEKRYLHKDGRVLWCLLTSTAIRDDDGSPLYLIGEVQDITDRRRAETELRESEERFRNLCGQAPVMLMSFDSTGRIRDVSDFWLETMGYARDEVVGEEGWAFITDESEARLRQAIDENLKNNETVIRNLPLQEIRKDGTSIDILCTSVAELDDSGVEKGAIAVQVNLTDIQRAEEALRESEERYRALVEYAPEAITVYDVDLCRFVDANAHAETLFGSSRDELLTMGPLDFCAERHSSDRPSCEVIRDEHERVLAGETSVFEFTRIEGDGCERHFQTRLSLLPAVGRRLIRATTTDITERKQLEERIRHADRLAAAGALAAGVAHEIGNPLTALSMAAQSLERRACDEYTQGKLGLIREHSERISRIVRQMSELARPQSKRKESCDLNAIVRQAVEMVRYDERARGSEIVYELSERLPSVEAVEDQINQVCINLALNAFDAMASNPDDRERRLTIRSTSTDGFVRVSFHDSGPGVPADLQTRLFEPFFTTKEAGRGSGLGLSVSYRILEELGGALRLDDGPSTGAVFVFELPLASVS